MELDEIVMKLVGPVHPLGEHNADQYRLSNMKKLTKLVDQLLFEINAAAANANRAEASMKAIGVHALEFIDSVRIAVQD